jgi:hypothetical protein
MPMQPGAPLEWCEPVDPGSDVLGDHRGNTEALNIRNARPGFHYYYGLNNPNQALRLLEQGFELVGADDPEQFGAQFPEAVGTPLDGLRAFNDVVLMRIPLDKYRLLRAERAENARAAREAPTQAFLSRGQEMNRILGSKAPKDGDSYYKIPGHGNDTQESP